MKSVYLLMLIVGALIASNVTLSYGLQATISDPLPAIPKLVTNYDGNISYENPTYGIRIDYPPDWQLSEPDETPSNGALTVARIYPVSSALESYATEAIPALSVSIVPLDLKVSISMDQAVTMELRVLRQLFSDLKVDSETREEIDGNLASRLTGSFTVFDQEVKLLQVMIMKGNKAYTLVFGAEPSTYNQLLPVVDKMISSFRVSDFVTYSSKVYGIKFNHPIGWDKIETSGLVGSSAPILTFLIPDQGISRSGSASEVYISIEQLASETVNMADVARLLDYQNQKGYHDFRSVSSNLANISGNPSYSSSFAYTVSRGEPVIMNVMQVLVLKGDKLYDIVYSTEANKYQAFLPDIRKLINSLELSTTNITKYYGESVSPSSERLESSNAYLTYNDHYFGIKVNYPQSWIHIPASGSEGVIAKFAPRGINLYTDPVGITMSIYPTSGRSIDDLIAKRLELYGKVYSDNYTINETKSIPLMGQKAKIVIYTTTDPIFGPVKTSSIFIKKYDRIYEVTFGSFPADFSKYYEVAIKMIGSLKITKPSPNSLPQEGVDTSPLI
jgi:photosystem II reaction center protein PsbP